MFIHFCLLSNIYTHYLLQFKYHATFSIMTEKLKIFHTKYSAHIY